MPDYVLARSRISDMEGSTMTLSDVPSPSFVALERVETFCQWRHCARARCELMTLSDRDPSDIGLDLSDIGLTRVDGYCEARESLW